MRFLKIILNSSRKSAADEFGAILSRIATPGALGLAWPNGLIVPKTAVHYELARSLKITGFRNPFIPRRISGNIAKSLAGKD
jgi:hypothetical protein